MCSMKVSPAISWGNLNVYRQEANDRFDVSRVGQIVSVCQMLVQTHTWENCYIMNEALDMFLGLLTLTRLKAASATCRPAHILVA